MLITSNRSELFNTKMHQLAAFFHKNSLNLQNPLKLFKNLVALSHVYTKLHRVQDISLPADVQMKPILSLSCYTELV